jgi:hypothetical protein
VSKNIVTPRSAGVEEHTRVDDLRPRRA